MDKLCKQHPTAGARTQAPLGSQAAVILPKRTFALAEKFLPASPASARSLALSRSLMGLLTSVDTALFFRRWCSFLTAYLQQWTLQFGRSTDAVEVPSGSSSLMMVEAGGWEAWGEGGHPSPPPPTLPFPLHLRALFQTSCLWQWAGRWLWRGSSPHGDMCTNYPDRTATPILAAR